MKKITLLFILSLIFSNLAQCQMQIVWQQCFGGSKKDAAYGLLQSDSGYMVVGYTVSNDGDVSYNHGQGDYWVVQTNSTGNMLWEKSFGGSLGDHGASGSLSSVSNDIYLVGGSRSIDMDISENPYPGTNNLWAVKIDSDGNIIWDRILGNTIGILSGDEYGASTNDGGVIMTGQIDSQGGDITTWYGGYDGWVVKLDGDGNTEWDFTIGSSTHFEFINVIIQTSDSGYLAGLYGTPQGAGTGNVDCITQSTSKPDAILFKLDASGNEEWHQCYGGSGSEGIARILEVEDGYVCVGWGGSLDGDLEGAGFHKDWNDDSKVDVWVVKTDFSGNIIWNKCYGGYDDDYGKFLFQTSDGGYMVFGNTFSFDGDVVGNPSGNEFQSSIWIFKINETGELQWQHCIGGLGDQRVASVIQKSDYNYVVASEVYFSPDQPDVNCINHGNGNYDYWLFELMDTTVNLTENIYSTIGVKVYPNPANAYAIFEVQAGNQSPPPQLVIRNIFGQQTAIVEMYDNTTYSKGQWRAVWDTRNIKPGIYVYTLKVAGMSKSGKILINK